MVVLSVADDNWQPMPPARVIGTETLTSSAQREDLYDTVIEVLDARSAIVLARTRVDANAIGLIGRDGFYSYAEHSGGEPKFVVWSVALSGVPDRRRSPSVAVASVSTSITRREPMTSAPWPRL